MKIKIDSKTLRDTLKTVGPATNSRSTIPILGCVNIVAGDTLTVEATNLEMGVSLDVNADIVEPGSIALPFAALNDIVSKAGEGDIIVTVKDTKATILIGKQKVHLNGLSSDDFPIQNISSNLIGEFSVSAGTISTFINKVAFAASKDQAFPSLQTVLLDVTPNEIAIASIDGYRLAESKAKYESGATAKVLIPVGNAKQLASMLSVAKWAKIIVYKGRLVVEMDLDGESKWNKATFTSSLVDGRMPDYRKTIPADGMAKIKIATDEMKRILAMAKVYTPSDTPGKIAFEFDGQYLYARSAHPELGDYFSGEIECETQGQPLSVTLSVSYLSDIFSAVTSKNVEVWLNPRRISAVFEEGNDKWVAALASFHD